MKIVYLVERLGPYHIFRLNHIEQHTLIALESRPTSGRYAWTDDLACRFCRTNLASSTEASMIDTLNTLDPQILFVTGYGFREMLWAFSWAVRTDCPLVMLSDSTKEDSDRSYVKESIKRFIVTNIQAALVAGARSRKYLEWLGLSRKAIFSPYDVVDNDFFSLADGLTSPEDSPYFLCVSRLIPDKHLFFLLDVFSKWLSDLKDTIGVVKLVILGNGPLEGTLRNRIAELDLDDRVMIRGFLPMELVRSYYHHGIALVLCSTSEPWGLCVNEAMAAGLPVIVSNKAGAAEDLIQQGKTGWLFSPKDADQLQNLLSEAYYLNSPARQQIIQTAKAAIKSFSIRQFVEGFDKSVIYAKKNFKKRSFKRMRQLALSQLSKWAS